MATAEASWVTLKEFRALYPAFQLTDELILQGGEISCGVSHTGGKTGSRRFSGRGGCQSRGIDRRRQRHRQ
jgi:hypothetical protein